MKIQQGGQVSCSVARKGGYPPEAENLQHFGTNRFSADVYEVVVVDNWHYAHGRQGFGGCAEISMSQSSCCVQCFAGFATKGRGNMLL